MAINVKMLSRTIIDAARGEAGERWSDARVFAEMELLRLAQTGSDIERLLRERRIDEPRARELFDIHRTSARSALLSAESITTVMAEAFLNVAIAVIGKAITRSLGINLF